MLLKHFWTSILKRFKTDVTVRYLQRRIACPVDKFYMSTVYSGCDFCVLCILPVGVWNCLGQWSCLLERSFMSFQKLFFESLRLWNHCIILLALNIMISFYDIFDVHSCQTNSGHHNHITFRTVTATKHAELERFLVNQDQIVFYCT